VSNLFFAQSDSRIFLEKLNVYFMKTAKVIVYVMFALNFPKKIRH